MTNSDSDPPSFHPTPPPDADANPPPSSSEPTAEISSSSSTLKLPIRSPLSSPNSASSHYITSIAKAAFYEALPMDILLSHFTEIRNLFHDFERKSIKIPEFELAVVELIKDAPAALEAFNKLLPTRKFVRSPSSKKGNDKIRKLREKGFSNTDGVHVPKEELMLRDSNYVQQLLQTENKKIEKLEATLHFIDIAPSQSNKHVYYVDDREEAKEIMQRVSKADKPAPPNNTPPNIKKKVESVGNN